MKKTRALLLACACLLTFAASRPAKSDDCIVVYFCQDCPISPTPPPPPWQRLCHERVCNGFAEFIACGDCTTHCIPPG